MAKNELFLEKRIRRNIDAPKSFFVAEKLRSDYICDFISPFHYHNWCELYYLKEGSCTYSIGKNKYVLNAGNWIFIPCDVDHKVFYNTSPHERILFYFTQDYFPFSMLDKMNLFLSNPAFIPTDKERIATDDIASKMVNEYKNPDKYSDELYKNLIFELLLFFVRRQSAAETTEILNLVTEHTIDYIRDNFNRNITLEELADMNYISTAHMSRKFKKDTGMTISDYIRKVRIDNAKKMLLETNDSISEISVKCGFNDSNYFSSVFKKQEKISPLKFKKLYL